MTSQPIRLSTNFMTLTPSLTFTDYEWFPWSICNGCGMPAGNAYPSGHLVPSPILGLANAPIVETKFLELAMSLLDFSPRIPLGTFSILLRSYSELLSKFGDISIQEYLSKGISHPVFYGDLVYKLRRVKDTPNFILSGSKIVKRLRRRHYDPVIIERTIGLVLGPSTALYEPFLKHCTLTNKAVGTI